jgi:hypothetical protein
MIKMSPASFRTSPSGLDSSIRDLSRAVGGLDEALDKSGIKFAREAVWLTKNIRSSENSNSDRKGVLGRVDDEDVLLPQYRHHLD